MGKEQQIVAVSRLDCAIVYWTTQIPLPPVSGMDVTKYSKVGKV